MRRLLPALVATLLLSVPALARADDDEKPVNEKDVPKAVVEALQKKYVGAKVTAWMSEEEDKALHYEAKIEVATRDKDGKESMRKMEVVLSSEGKILEEEEKISTEALPDSVKKGLADSKFAKGTVTHVARIVKNEKTDDPTYEIALVLDKQKVEVTFDKAGKVLEEEGAEEANPVEPAMEK